MDVTKILAALRQERSQIEEVIVSLELLAFSRGRRVALQRTATTEDWALQMTRIANAIERIASSQADRLIAEASRTSEAARNEKPETTIPPPEPGQRSILNSMFGR